MTNLYISLFLKTNHATSVISAVQENFNYMKTLMMTYNSAETPPEIKRELLKEELSARDNYNMSSSQLHLFSCLGEKMTDKNQKLNILDVGSGQLRTISALLSKSVSSIDKYTTIDWKVNAIEHMQALNCRELSFLFISTCPVTFLKNPKGIAQIMNRVLTTLSSLISNHMDERLRFMKT